jgi:hypothetical protein
MRASSRLVHALHESQDVDLAQPVSCDDALSIRRYGAGEERVIAGVGGDDLTAVQIPDQKRTVVRDGDHPLTVARHLDRLIP